MSHRPGTGAESIQLDDTGESTMQQVLSARPSTGSGRVARAIRRTGERLARATGADRGDVPGWVLITLMTAGLVIALWAVAGPALTAVFTDSIARVTGQIG